MDLLREGTSLKTLRILFTLLSALLIAAVIPLGAIFSWTAAGIGALGALLFFLLMLLCKQKQEENEREQNDAAQEEKDDEGDKDGNRNEKRDEK